MKNIFLTGATGVMGFEGLKELSSRPDKYKVTVLARPSKKNKKKLSDYIVKGVKVIWGDLLDSDSVDAGVKTADIVLHVGGMVSPMADWYPEKTIKVNLGAMGNIIDAVKRLNPNAKVVYIGSVAQYGNYEAPYHWGECGDLMSPSKFDAYAYSKTEAEKMLATSGIKHWVSFRQTGILHWGLLLNAQDPIAFHVPIRGVLEWVTAEDSGRLLERVCREGVPDSFWNNFYNIGGGAAFRLTNYEFESMLLKAIGCPPPEEIFETNWFATQNFHGCWYKDSDKLEDILHFREDITPEQYFERMKRRLPWYFKLAPLAPAWTIKSFMKSMANNKSFGTLHYIKEKNQSRIDAMFGSIEGWENIPGWDRMDLSRPDDSKPEASGEPAYSEYEVRRVIEERGGELLSAPHGFDPDSLLSLKCCLGHEFNITPRALIAGGHWCSDCLKQSVGVKIN